MKAPFPWYGGKSRVAHLVWDAFGDVRNYVEPFAGSLAVLLARPTPAKIETVNDLDYEGEHVMPARWRELQWKANGGFANQASSATQGRANAARERIWFSPYCLHRNPGLFE